jgi:NAD(P)-dependent dehydrogenase (short-subunit alcohol dehydrogenase family)
MSTVNFKIQDSVAFVTGTNKKNGLGRAIVDALLLHGAKKVYATARDAKQLDYLVESSNGLVVAVSLDVTDAVQISKLGELYPDVNLVINNAGYFVGTSTLEGAEKALMEMEVNYAAPLRIVQTFAKSLKENQTETNPSAVVNVASIASLVNFPPAPTYSASKAAAHSLTQAQRRDLGNTTLVVGVYPGPIETDMSDGLPFDKVSPSSVADAIVEALMEGKEDVFPDPISQDLFKSWQDDAKAIERTVAQSAASA